jgi:hypothetical protein
MLVLRRGDQHGVDILVVQQAAKVRVGFEAGGNPGDLLETPFEDIRGGHSFDALTLKGRLDDFRAPRAGSNQADADAVVGSQDALGSEQSARRNGTGPGNMLEKCATSDLR